MPLPAFNNSQVSPNGILLDNHYQPALSFDNYDQYGNLLQQHKVNDVNHSYIWDYTNSLPIAEVNNAAQADIAYTSFETETGKGNWDFFNNAFSNTDDQPNIESNNPVTGKRVYALGANSNGIRKANLKPADTYVLTYWYYLNDPVITGVNNLLEKKIITQKHSWTLVSIKFNNTSAITINAPSGGGSSLDCAIDELRLYPSDAQMITFTYEPLVGMTSQCDAANYITYYEYDGLGRLSLIRDHNQNILKKICYSFSGQSAPCAANSTSCLPVVIQQTALSSASQDIAYSQTISLSGTAAFTLSNVLKPSWMTISISGSSVVLSGTPDDPGTSTVSFTISNCNNATDTYTGSITVNPLPTEIHFSYVNGDASNDYETGTLTGMPGATVTVTVTDYVNNNSNGSLTADGTSVYLNYQFTKILNSQGIATFGAHIFGNASNYNSAVLGKFTITAVSSGTISSSYEATISKVF